MMTSPWWRLLIGLTGLAFSAFAVAVVVGGRDAADALIGLAILPFGLAMLLTGVSSPPQRGAVGTVRAGTFPVAGAQVRGLMLVPTRRRIALSLGGLLGIGVTWTVLLVALVQETVIGGLVLGFPGPLCLGLAAVRARHLARPERAGVLLTVDGVSLDGGRHWAGWDDLHAVGVAEPGRGRRQLEVRRRPQIKQVLRLTAGATDADLDVLAAVLRRLWRDPAARELVPSGDELTLRMLSGA